MSGGSSGPPAGDLFAEILPWLGALAALVVVGVVVVYAVRRFVRGVGASPMEGFTLQDLRDMHDAGRLSDEEFERARAAIIGRSGAAGGRSDHDARAKREESGPESPD